MLMLQLMARIDVLRRPSKRYGNRRYETCRMRRKWTTGERWRIGPCGRRLRGSERLTGACTACAKRASTRTNHPCDVDGNRLSTEQAIKAIRGQGGTPVPMTNVSEPPPLRRGFRHISGWLGFAINRSGTVLTCRSPGSGRIGFVPRWRVPYIRTHKQGYRYFRAKKVNGGSAQYGRIHQLVLETFVGPCPPRMEACHNDGKEWNNRLSNLRWDTRGSNMRDRVRHGYRQWHYKSRASKLTPQKVRAIRASTEPHAVLAKRYRVHWKTISNVRHRHCWYYVK
jgi:hypothetical protein